MLKNGASLIELKRAHERIKVEYSLIAAHEHTSNLSVYESDLGYYIEFEITYDESCDPVDSRICCPELITLRYLKPVEIYQAPEIWATRNGFPKDLPHLNPTRVDESASICLWRNGGNKALYDNRGVRGFLDILVQWLTDAQDETLQQDGWEPTPRGSDIQIDCALGDLQSEAHKKMSARSQVMYSNCRIVLWPDVEKPVIGNVSFQNMPTHCSQIKYSVVESSGKFEADSAIVLLIAPRTNIVSRHNSLDIRSEEDFNSYLTHCDISYCADFLKSYAKSLLYKGRKPKYFQMSVLIAHKRPIRLIEDIPDLAHGEAGKVELIALLATMDAKEDKITFRPCSVASRGTRTLLSKVSATNDIAEAHVIIAGCGAIGSSVAEMLCKQGIRELTLIDKDRFSPHNPARHVLGKCYTEMPKVFGLSSFLTRHYHPEKITPLLDEIGSPSINVNELMQEKLFVDCTANPNVADVIDTIARAEPAVKCYISMAGRVGILLSKSSRETFFDLEVLGYYAAVENSEITEWLLNDGVLGLTTLGIGCGSDTFELPYATISSHNSVFQTLINKKLRNADSNGIHINFLDENFLPAKYIEVEVPEFKEFNPIDEAHEWTIALSSRARNTIENSTKLCQPNEAAGYLLGSFNARIKRITIVAATHVDQQMPSPTNANLPPVSQDNIAMDILNKTNSLIVPVGTWHSHPAGSAQPSLKDKGTFSGLINLLGDNPQPYVMLISNGEQEQTTSLIIPEKWH